MRGCRRNRSLPICIAAAALFAVVAPLASAGGQPPPGAPSKHDATSPPPPQAFCQTPPAQTKGEPPDGFYRVRPHGCRFHRLGLEENGLSDLTFRIHWRHWTGASAAGIGREHVSVLNLKTHRHYLSSEPVAVRLSRPRRVCGHEMFTELEKRAYLGGKVANDFKSELDEVGAAGEGCPQAGGPGDSLADLIRLIR